MPKIIFISFLLCASASFAQTPFDSFDTTMKSVPLFKSDKPQTFRLEVSETNTSTRYLILDVDNSSLAFYNAKDSLLKTTKLKPKEVKFLSVDPLTKKYPELTPYQFASNTPIQAVDLDGKEAFFVHGTLSGPDSWQKSGLTNYVKENMTNNIHMDDKFSWKRPNGITGINANNLFNGEGDRKDAAQWLVAHVMQYRRENR